MAQALAVGAHHLDSAKQWRSTSGPTASSVHAASTSTPTSSNTAESRLWFCLLASTQWRRLASPLLHRSLLSVAVSVAIADSHADAAESESESEPSCRL